MSSAPPTSATPNPPVNNVYQGWISEVFPNLFIGDARCLLYLPTIRKYNIKAALSLREFDKHLCQLYFKELVPQHIWIECADSSTQDLLQYMDRCCHFIEQNLNQIQDGGVLVHCQKDISRSSTMVIAYLIRRQRRGVEGISKEMRLKRDITRPSRNFMRQLRIWKEAEYQIWESDIDREDEEILQAKPRFYINLTRTGTEPEEHQEKRIPKAAYQQYLDGSALKLKKKGLRGNEILRSSTPDLRQVVQQRFGLGSLQ
ncbi:uncharacterized protein PAC_15759 [Phialocephala subalpina]|uniref:protein-tyrosine-phosphatase n=1 Tax=Phialocephala subalpina TaxID=576137 RepID=A0A1L7XLE2_9HELO|nr:uncharacterized protein PAC_15759 [Phialocephala subalpina]